jgi:hypothetical protein
MNELLRATLEVGLETRGSAINDRIMLRFMMRRHRGDSCQLYGPASWRTRRKRPWIKTRRPRVVMISMPEDTTGPRRREAA